MDKNDWDRSIEEIAKEIIKRAKESHSGRYRPFAIAQCSCSSFERAGPHEAQSLPLKVFVKPMDSQHQQLITECMELSINLINEVLDRDVLVSSNSKPKRGDAAVYLELGGKAHGATSMNRDYTGRIYSPSQRGIWMQLRLKADKTEDQQRKEYVSTLSHELFHALGFGHIMTTKKEIMSVGRGGTCICSKCPVVPKKLRWHQSPRTLSALQWLYGTQSSKLAAKYGGMPTCCNRCFVLGW
eukprot:CAMPEP_0201484580 /NCGR_PEP_ID=MMETSP0151_2-20130828/8750_1 /ASSEMBLY_ACC=CAM_ASM_000257 /TAXON_ID=200890 /ORGANISM="Paramoeba atlantica, Strain 621/1 / CCAP 1560/9" /LENGTH=240 /DNA_ID=CAMNT_0047868309 /DNA_START=44 /DNA_END=763 /DNA_ORIENTATION=-